MEAQEKPSKFWMISNSRGPSRKRYRDLGKAVADAVRLANENPGRKFHVLETVAYYRNDGAEVAAGDSLPYES